MWGTTILKNPILWTLAQQEGRSPQKPGRLPPQWPPLMCLEQVHPVWSLCWPGEWSPEPTPNYQHPPDCRLPGPGGSSQDVLVRGWTR